MKNIYFKQFITVFCLAFMGLFSVNQTLAQCTISVSPTSATVCAGSPVTLTATFNTSSTRTYAIPLAQLINLGSSCDANGTNRYNGCAAGNSGFSWTDIGSGTVTNVNVQFYVGIECSVGSHTSSLDGVAGPTYSTTIASCNCTNITGGGEAISLNFPNPTGYTVGSTNTFLTAATNCFGFIQHAALNNNYAIVTVTYSAGGTGSVLWNTGATSNSITVSPGSTTTYTVAGTTAGNTCSANASATVNVNALPVATASSNSPVNSGSALNLTSSGGTSYSWTGPNSFTSTAQNPTIATTSVASAGTYTVTATNAAGCSSKATTKVSINSGITNTGLPAAISAAAAYSTRKLSPNYTGAALNARRSLDNAQADIAFDANGTISNASIATITVAGTSGLSVGTTMAFSTFYGSGNAQVAIYYDQSGNGRNATQTIAGSQPFIVLSGSITTLNGKPAILFNGGPTLNVPFSSTLINAQGTFSAVQQQPSLQSGYQALISWSSGSSIFGPGFGPLDGAGKFGLYTTFGSASYVNAGPVAANIPYVIEATWTGSGSSVTTTRNGGAAVSGALTNLLTANIANGTIGVDNGSTYGGYLSELIILPSALSATDRQTLEANQMAYYITPTLTSFAPTSAGSGQTVTLTGTNLAATSAVSFGGTPATSFSVASATSVSATVGAGATGNVSVTTPGGTATLGGFTYLTPATALNFDGVNDVVNLNNTVGNVGAGDFTIEMNIRTTYAGGAYLFSKRSFCGGDNFISIQIGGGKVGAELGQDGAGTQYLGLGGTHTINDNVWHHIALTRKSGVVTLYVDGAVDATGNSTANVNNSYVSTLGYSVCTNQNGSVYFSGDMDELRVWSRAVCATELTANKGCGLSIAGQTGLVALYHFDQGSINFANTGVSTLTDNTGNGNNGTLTNFALSGTTSNWVAGTVSGTCAAFTSPNAAITGTTTVCLGTTTTLANAIAGGAWTSSSTSVATINASGVITPVSAGTTTITYTNLCGGVSTATVTVNNTPTPTIYASGATTFCAGGSVNLNVSALGNAMQMNGTQYAQSNNSTLPVGNTSRTIEAWVKTTTSTNGVIANWGQPFTNQRSGLIIVNSRIYYVGENNDLQGNINISDGNWHHVAATFDGTTLKLYVDGALDVSSAKSFNTSGTTLRIGQRSIGDAGSELYNGIMDELRIWNVARTQTELQNNRFAEIPGNSSGLVAYYKLNETTGLSLTDASVNNVTSTLTAAATWIPSNAPGSFNSYAWTPGGATTSSITANATGNYTVTVSNTQGCSATSVPITVTVNPLPTITGTLVACAPTSRQLTGSGTPAASNPWTSSNTSIATVDNTGRVTGVAVAGGSAVITYTDANGCSITANFTVPALPPTPTVSVVNNCDGTSVLTASGFTSYQWALSGGPITATGTSITVNTAGTYVVRSAGTQCVSAFASIAATPNTAPNAPTSGGDQSRCGAGNLTLSATPPASAIIDWYSASSGGTLLQSSSNTYVVSTATTVYAEARNSTTGCVSTTRTAVSSTINSPVTPTFTQVAAICAGVSLSALPTTSDNGITGSWSPALNNTATTTYTFTPSVGMCAVTTTMTLTVNPLPVVTAGNNSPVTAGNTLNLTSSGGTTYSWSGPNSFTSTSQNPSIATVTTAAAGVYSVTATNNGCSATASTTVTINVPFTPVITFDPRQVSIFAGSGTAGSGNGTGTAAQFSGPTGIVMDASGNMYVTDYSGNTIRKITPAGVVTTIAGSGVAGSANGTGTAAQFKNPTGIALDPTQTILYVGDQSNFLVRKIVIATGVVTTFAGTGQQAYLDGPALSAKFTGPAGVTVDQAGNVYVSDYQAGNHIRMISSSGIVSTIATGLTAYPTDLKRDVNGNFYVSGGIFGSTVEKVTPGGVVSIFSGSGTRGYVDGIATAAQYNFPSGIALDAGGNIYLTESDGNRVRKIRPSGTVTTLAGNGQYSTVDGLGTSASIYGPTGIVMDAAGNLFVTEYGNNRIRKMSVPAATSFSTLIGSASAAQQFNISGASLTGNVTVTAPSGFEVSLASNSGYASSISITPSSSEVAPTAIFVRLAVANTSGTYSGNVTLSSTGAATQNLAVTGSVNCPVISVSNVAGGTTFCAGTSTSFTASSSASSPVFNWYDAATGGNLLYTGATYTTPVLAASTDYYVDVTSGTCPASARRLVSVTINPLPTATISGSASVCKNNTAPSITFTGANGTAPYVFTYTINGGTPLSATTVSGNSVSVNAPTSVTGSFVYTLVSVRESSTTLCSATVSGSATVVVNALPTAGITVNGNATICSGGSVVLSANAGSGYTYQWYKDGGLINGETAINYSATQSGSYTVAVTSSGCTVVSAASVVSPGQAPVISNCPQTQYTQIYADANSCSTAFTYNLSITGSPAAVVTYTFTGATTANGSGTGSGSAFNVGQTTVTVTATNGCGTATCIFVVTVIDNTLPTAITKNITVYLNAAGQATIIPQDINNGSFDNCGPVTLSLLNTGTICATATENQNAVLTAPSGTVITAIDFASYGTPNGSCGNFSIGSCNSSSSLSVVQARALNQNSVAIPASNNIFGDPCGGTVKRLYIQAIYSGGAAASNTFNCTKLGNNTITLTVTDANGNVSKATAIVTVRDTIKPTITAPANITRNTDASGCTVSKNNIAFGTPVTSDNCSVTVTTNAPQNFPIGVTNVTWTATDNSGNTATAIQVVTVQDKTGPTINTPTIYVNAAQGNCSAVVNYDIAASATDCTPGAITVTYSIQPGSVFRIGSTPVTVTATDILGNIRTAQFVVVVRNVTPPSIIQPADITVNSEPGLCGAHAGFSASATDCESVTILYSIQPGSLFAVGTTPVSVTAVDASGNISVATFNVIVLDKEPPVIINMPAAITKASGRDSCGTVVYYAAPTTTDNCKPAATQTFSFAGGVQTFTVPAGVTSIDVDMAGAAGGQAAYSIYYLGYPYFYGDPAKGGRVQAKMAVTPGQVLYLNVGGAGQSGADPYTVNAGGYNGGGNGSTDYSYYVAGGGGGASDIRTADGDLNSRIIVAGGGGGLGDYQSGGNGGDLTGEDAYGSYDTAGGGTQWNGGRGAGNNYYYYDYYTDGGFGYGGNGYDGYAGGGGGGGWYGGGSGFYSNGAGGSSYTDQQLVSAVTHTQAYQSGDGSITLSWTGTGGATIVQTQGLPSGSVFPVGTTTNTFEATDVAGNKSNSSFNVVVKDNQFPVLAGVPSNVTVECDVVPAAATVTASDNCATSIPVYSETRTNGTCPNNYTLTRTWSTTDASGNRTSATQMVTVRDTKAPILTVPSNISVNNDNNTCGAIVSFAASATDNCGTATIVYSQNPGTVFTKGTTIVTVTATDDCGNAISKNFTVMVTDNQPPVIVCPGDMTVIAASAAGVVVNYTTPVGTDNCAGVTTTLTAGLASGSIFPIGPTVVTYTATDAAGLTASCSFNVLVKGLPPVINCPANIVVSSSTNACGANVNYAATENTGIPVSTISYSIAPGSFFPVGTTTVTATATNAVGTSICTFTVKVVDDVAPIVITKNITIQLDATGNASITPAMIDNGSSDNCSIATFSLDKTSFDCSNVSSNEVNLTVTDSHGNVSSATAFVTVEDKIAPTVITKNITIQLDANGAASITPSDINNGSTDNCSIVSYSLDKTSFDCSNVGTNTVALTVADVNSNVSTATAVVTVQDNVAPVVITQNIIVQLDANGHATIAPADINNGSSDNCSIASYSLNKTGFDCSNVGNNTVILTVTDVNGNVSTAAAEVTVQDNVVPVVITKNITVQLDANGAVSITPANINNGSTDNCSIATYSLDKTSFNCSNIGTNAVTLTVTDVNGNVSTGAAVVTVEDKVAPIVITQNITVQLDANGNASITPAQIDNGSTDNCAIATYSLDKTSFDCSNVGTNTVTLTVTDVHSNVSNATAVVTIEDKVVPTVITQNITVQLDPNGNASITPAQIDNGSTDNCAIATYSLDKTSFNCSNVGTNTVTLTVTDVHGNISTATAVVTVEDKVVPTVITQNITIQLDANGAATITPAQVNNGSTDNCAISSYSLDKTSFDCSNVGTNTVTLTATDVNGNQNSATAVVMIEDHVPAVVLTNNITIQLSATGAASITVADINNGSHDACAIASMMLSKTAFDCSNAGDNTVTLTVTDVNGNVSSNTAVVTVKDLVPAVVLTKNITIQLNTSGTATIAATDVNNGSNDACGIAGMTVSPNVFSCANVGNNTVTLTVTDVNGNVSSNTAIVTVQDLVAPVVVTKPITVNLDGTGHVNITAADINNGSSDACGIATMVLSKTSFDCSNIGPNTVTLTVTDVNGNVSTNTAIVTVQDILGPVPTLVSLPSVSGLCSAGVVIYSGRCTDNCRDCRIVCKCKDNCRCHRNDHKTISKYDNDDDDDCTYDRSDVVYMTTPTAMDNCSGLITGTTTDPLSYTMYGTHIIHWSFTDTHGNTTVQEQTVTITDNVAPKPWLTSLPVIKGECSVTVGLTNDRDDDGEYEEDRDDDHEGDNDHDHWNAHHSGAPWAWDNCAGWIRATTTDPLTYSTQGTYTIHWTFDDGHGNTTVQLQTVIVNDDIAPRALVYNLPTVYGQCSATVTTVPAARDNCVGIVYGTTTNALSYNVQGTYTITWTYSDGRGNTSTQTQKVVVDDNTKPVPMVSTLPTVTGECSATVTTMPKANDNCKGVITGTTTDPLTYTKEGTYTIHWSYNDGNGNITTQNQTVVINDVTAPVPQVSVLPTLTGECSVTATAPKANDNCKGVITATTNDAVTYTRQGTYTIHWSYNDGNGNISTQNQTVVIDDNTSPVITAPVAATVNCGGSTAPTVTATATDNCSGTIAITYSDVTSGNTITRTWKATDAAGNFSTAAQTLTIVDITAPVIVDIKDVTVSCGTSTSPSVTGTPKATDNCGTPVVSFTDVTSGYTITRTWTAKDAFNNMSSSVQVITIVDNTKPVITDIADVTVNCGASTLPAATGTPNATDNCSTVTVNYGDVPSGNTIIRTWTAKDASGNTATSTQVITIGSLFTTTVSSVPTSSTYTGGASTNLYLGYGAQSTSLQVGSLPSAGAPYTYVWSGTYTNRLSSTTSAAPVFTPSIFGYYTFSVTVTNKYGCTFSCGISICVTDVRVAGTNGAKIYVTHTPNGKNAVAQTLQVALSSVSSHIGSGSCGSNGNDRLGSADQSPCNTTIVNATGVTNSGTAKDGEVAVTTSTEEDLKVTAMPNPSTTYFTLKIESRYQTPVELRVMDGRGRVVDAKSKIGANSTIQIGHSYSSGTYYAELIQGTQRKVVQLIKGRG